LVNDDVLKLWEETEADNRRLLSEMGKIRSQIKETKYQIEKISSKATSMTVLSDIERREKKEVMGKLHEMEKELKLLAKSESMTDQSLNQLKGDNNRLREENLSLIRVISKLSGGEHNVNQVMNMMGRPRQTSSYVCRHGRVHNYNNTNNTGSGYNSNITNSQMGMTQQPVIQPQQQGPATNMDQIAGVGFMNSQEYSTPVPSLGNQGYPTPSMINNQGYTTPNVVNNQGYTTPSLVNNQSYTTPSMVNNQGYTTPSLVNSQGYTTPSLLNNQGYTTPSLVNNQGYTTPSLVNNQGYTTPSLVNNQGYTTPSLVNNQGYTTPSLVNNQGYTTPSLVNNQGYTTPSLVNNSGAGYAGVQYQPQAYQAVQYVPNAGHVQTQSVFPS